MRFKDEEGQAIIIVALAMSIFLIGAVGLGIDGSHIYSQRQMAQTAADAAAVSGIMSVFDGTNASGAAAFSTGSSFTCGRTDARTPCVYAARNGFGGSASDTVTIDFPAESAAPGVNFSAAYPVTLIRATVTRRVNTTLMRMLGPSSSNVSTTAMAAIVSVVSPVPILVTHPSLATSLKLQGTPTITICGGPSRSIQVNSGSSSAAATGGNASIDLSHAGPPDPGNCSSGTGADLGVWGGPTTSPSVNYGTTGQYVQPASPIADPLASVTPPSVPAASLPSTHLIAGQTSVGVTCPATAGPHGCTVLTPGLYPSGLSMTNTTAIFKPGIYYMQTGGFGCTANCNVMMASGIVDGPPPAGTNTGWDGTPSGGGILVYNTGVGQINVGANGTTDLIGSPPTSAYKGILFFEDRNAAANTGKNAHSLGGGGAMTLVGTIYLTNPLATMNTTSAHYQELDLQGGSGSGTLVQGEIIVGTLQLGGNGAIAMNLSSTVSYTVSQVALVN